MRSYVYGALKQSVDKYQDDAGEFASILKDIVVYGAQDRCDRATFVNEIARVLGFAPDTIEGWAKAVDLPPPSVRKATLQGAFDQILNGRP